MEKNNRLSAGLEPFDSFWQGTSEVEKGYAAFGQFYRANYLEHLPADKDSEILVVSCGPGYFISLLNELGYHNVLGIDSDPEKIEHALKKKLTCRVEDAFPFLSERHEQYDLIICEQELNHLTIEEMVRFVQLCWHALKHGGTLVVYSLNGANPITSPDSLAHNLDHFNTLTEYSLSQVLKLGGFSGIRVLPLRLYVFYENPLNYVGLAATAVLHLAFRLLFKLYGKSNRIFTKKIAAVGTKTQNGSRG